MTPNEMLLEDIAAVPRALLDGSAAFGALGLKQFWRYDGKILPYDASGKISIDLVPAWNVFRFFPRNNTENSTPSRQEFEVEFDGGIIYPDVSSDGVNSSSHATRALLIAQDVIDNKATQRSRMNSGGLLTSFEFIPGDVEPLISAKSAVVVDYWVANWKLILRTNRHRPENVA